VTQTAAICGKNWKDENEMLTHGKSKTPIYRMWWGMLSRCNHPKTRSYSRYGGRGIKVCDRWHTFANFYEDMGERPVGSTIDRIDNNGDYAPNNCRWTSNKMQQHNKATSVRVWFNGVEWLQVELCKHLNVSGTHIPRNMARGMTRVEAINHLIALKEKRNAKKQPH
jgi:hypothetical protein